MWSPFKVDMIVSGNRERTPAKGAFLAKAGEGRKLSSKNSSLGQ